MSNPNAKSDFTNTLTNVPVSINVTANDTDPDGDPLIVGIISQPKNGIAILNANKLDYTPNTAFTGFDTLYYRVCDNGLPSLCDSAMVVIQVRTPGQNKAPDAVNDSITIHINTIVKINVTANDSDPDGDPFTPSMTVNPQHGNAYTGGKFIFYTPDFNYIGFDTMYYQICDNGIPQLCDSARVVVRMVTNNPPVAANDFLSICENAADTIIKVQQNDADPDGDSLSISILRPAAHGTATISGKQIVYKPDSGYFGKDSLSYRICDQDFCDSAVLNITINQRPAAFTGPDQEINYGESTLIGGTPISGHKYLWLPATGLSSNSISNPLASPLTTTWYTLQETDLTSNCSNMNQVLITVNEEGFYNGFSPNGDGKNDYWRIPFLLKFPANTVTIVNRLGEVVWKASNYDNANIRFNGENMNGTELPDGTYFYIIKYNNEEKTGWVIIKR